MLAIAGSKKIKIIFYFSIFILLSTISSLENYKTSTDKNIFNLNMIEIVGANKINSDLLQLRLDNELLGQNLYSLSSQKIANMVPYWDFLQARDLV